MSSANDIAPIARGERLKRLIAFMGITRAEFAALLGCSLATVSYWENAKQGGIQRKGAKQVVDLALSKDVTCSVEWLMEGSGEPPRLVKKGKVVSYMPEPRIQNEELGLFLGANPNSLNIINDDYGMLPYYKVGDIIGCVLTPSEQVDLGVNGEIGIVTLNNDPHIRVITLGERAGTFNLNYIHYSEETKRPHQINGVKLHEIGVIKRLWRK